MNFNRLDSKELASIGIVFESEDESVAFADLIKRELEIRIGEKVSENATSEQLDRFDRCTTPQESLRWLETYCPHFRSIVSQEQKSLEAEMIKYRNEIPGVVIKNSD